MKKFLLALFLFFAGTAAASATCTSPAVMKDNAGSTFNMSLSTNADTNCQSNIGASVGAIADGASVTQGAKADTVCSTATGTCSLTALIKFFNQAVTSAIPPCTAAPCAVTIGNTGSDPSSGVASPSSVAVNISTAATTQLIAISGSKSIYITSYNVIAGGTGTFTFEYGTGSNCGTGTTALTGTYQLTAQNGIAIGSGVGTILKVPSGNALCALTSTNVSMAGSVSYQQF